MPGYFESQINDVPGNADSLATLATNWDTYGKDCDGFADDVMASATSLLVVEDVVADKNDDSDTRTVTATGTSTWEAIARRRPRRSASTRGRYARGRATSRTFAIRRPSSMKR